MKDLKEKEYLSKYYDTNVNKGDICFKKVPQIRDDVYPFVKEKNEDEFEVYMKNKYGMK